METSGTLVDALLMNEPSPGSIFIALSAIKQKGDVRRVIQECHKALERYPRDIPIRRLLAEIYFEDGQLTQAELHMGRVLAEIERVIPAYRLMAVIYAKQGRAGEALDHLNRYLAHRPDDEEMINLKESLLPSAHMPSEEVPEATEALPEREETRDGDDAFGEQEPFEEIATPTLAEIYFEQGQFDDAIATYTKVISQRPEDQRARQRLAELQQMMEREKTLESPPNTSKREKTETIISTLETWRDKICGKSAHSEQNV